MNVAWVVLHWNRHIEAVIPYVRFFLGVGVSAAHLGVVFGDADRLVVVRFCCFCGETQIWLGDLRVVLVFWFFLVLLMFRFAVFVRAN